MAEPPLGGMTEMTTERAAHRLRPGDPAPDATISTPDGPAPLAGVWADGPVIVTFLRHFG